MYNINNKITTMKLKTFLKKHDQKFVLSVCLGLLVFYIVFYAKEGFQSKNENHINNFPYNQSQTYNENDTVCPTDYSSLMFENLEYDVPKGCELIGGPTAAVSLALNKNFNSVSPGPFKSSVLSPHVQPNYIRRIKKLYVNQN